MSGMREIPQVSNDLERRFLTTWSKNYKAIKSRPDYVPHPTDKIPKAICSENSLRRQAPKLNSTDNAMAMRFFFDEEQAKRLKARCPPPNSLEFCPAPNANPLSWGGRGPV